MSSALARHISSTSHWASHTLFISFMANNPIDVIRDVRDRRRAITWDLKTIAHIRSCLRSWVKDEVPADIIGAFLVNILYQRDYHLGYRLTTLVRENRTAAHIARRALAFYQVHDKAGKPLWVQETNPKPVEKSQPLIPAAEHADLRWPSFLDRLDDYKLERLIRKLGDASVDEKALSVALREVKSDEISIVQTFHRFNIHAEDSPEVYTQLRDSAHARNSSRKADPLSMKSLQDALPSLATEKPLPDVPPKGSAPSSPVPGPPVVVQTFDANKKSKTRSSHVDSTDHSQRKTHTSSTNPRVYTGDFSTGNDAHPELRRPQKSNDLRKDRERDARRGN